jgi:hypothetical protein
METQQLAVFPVFPLSEGNGRARQLSTQHNIALIKAGIYFSYFIELNFIHPYKASKWG